MTKVLFYLVIRPLAFLPLRVLYVLSKPAYLILYKLIGYRKDIVSENIQNSFPEKSPEEQEVIIQNFYRYISDLMLETVWTFGFNEKRVRKRFTIENPELLDRYFDQNKSVIIILAHYSCWELVLSSMNLFVKHQCETIYIPLSSKEFDRQYMKMRTKFGSTMIAKKDFKNSFENNNLNRAIIFGADQSPSISKNIHWTTFLHQETAVALGAEKYAKKYDLPVVYAHLHPVTRGQFKVRFKLVTDKPQELNDGYITDAHVHLLESQIIEQPAYWLWSHRRWKKKRE